MSPMRRPYLLGLLLALARPSMAGAQQAALPPSVVALDAPEGHRLLVTSDASDDFFRLSNQWVSQQLGSYCGVASSVMVLNALQLRAPTVAAWSPYNAFTQDNVFENVPTDLLTGRAVSRGGMTIDQLGAFLAAHSGVNARVVHASDTTADAFRDELARNLATANDYLIVNYDRAGVGQETMGHISPLGAFNRAADRVLVMDVARYKYPAVWVSVPDLFRAISTQDPITGRSRGFVAVTYAPGARAVVGPRPRSGLPPFVIRVLAAVFALGAAVGGALVAWLKRRRV